MRVLEVALKIELPDHTVRLCGGGTLVFDAESYTSNDNVIGTIAAPEAFSEGIGDEQPAASILFAPPADVAASSLIDPLWQGSRVRAWVVEIDPDTGVVTGDAEQLGDAQIDVSVLRPRGSRSLELTLVPATERMFLMAEGNSLNGSFHRKAWPGEQGLDNAAGVGVQFAWGAADSRGVASSGGGIGKYALGAFGAIFG